MATKKILRVLITGASTGIGFAVADSLCKKGHTVFAGCRKDDDAVRLQDIGCTPIIVDVTNPEQRIQAVEQLNGDLDILVNNAGIAVAGPVEAVTLDEFRKQIEVNVFALYEMVRLTLPLIRKNRGRIINISSISGKMATPFMAPYAASKHAVEAITDSLRREVEEQGVTIVSINPGPIKTPIWDKSITQAEDRLNTLKDEIRPLYQHKFESMRKLVADFVVDAAPVDDVVRDVEKAIFEKRPKTRYFPGKGIRLQAMLARLAPDRIADKLIMTRFR